MKLFLPILLLAVAFFPQEGWLEKAQQLFEAGRYAEAKDAYQQAIEAYPSRRGPILYNLAQCYLALDSTEKALEALHQAASPQDTLLEARAYNQIGVILAKENKLEQALRYFRRALKAAPSLREAAYNHELVMRLIASEQPPEPGEGKPDEEEESETAPPDSQAEEGAPPDSEDSPPQEDETNQPSENQPLSQWQVPSGSDRPLNRQQEQISLEEARQILEGMQENELRFLQQLRKAPVTSKKETGKPDW